VKFLYGKGDGIDLLDKLGPKEGGDGPAPAACNKYPELFEWTAKGLFYQGEEFEDLMVLPGFMPLVVVPEYLVSSGIKDDGLYRGRTHVKANEEMF